MNKLLACALGLLALGLFSGVSRADDDKKAPEAAPAVPAAPEAAPAAMAAPVVASDCSCNSGCGHKSVAAASCCDDCCKPRFCDRLKEKFRKKDCCDTCAAPKCETCKPAPVCNTCNTCDTCSKPKLWDRLCAGFKKNDCGCEAPKPACCEAPKPACDSCCKPKHSLFTSHKSCDSCNTCNTCGAPPMAPIAPIAPAPAMKAEVIPAPMPK